MEGSQAWKDRPTTCPTLYLSGDVAWICISRSKGTQRLDCRGTRVLQRRGERWLIVQSHESQA
ncbi:MAG: nuclear transport factor 2 family protein [Anaerolineae bacterium]